MLQTTRTPPARPDGGLALLGLTGIQETHDPTHWERVSQPWEVLGTPVDGRRFRNRKVFVATPDCILYHESFASPLQVRALSPEGMLALSVPVRAGARTSYFRRPLHEQGIPTMLPGAAEAMLDAGQQHCMLLLRLALLEQLLTEEQMATLVVAAGRRCLALSPAAAAGLGRVLCGLLTRVRKAPEMLWHAAAVRALERELVMGLAALLPAGRERPAPASLRQRGFDRAIAHLRAADLAVLDQAALCAAAGVSPRTLEYAFRENLGLSPAAFVRQLRLHGLRRELLASRLGETTVTEVAFHLGFTQLGRLAGDYCRAFGERPSATLARPLTERVPGFRIGSGLLAPVRAGRSAAGELSLGLQRG